MDQNFLHELISEGEKKFAIEIPFSMSMMDALSNLQATMDEIIGKSSDWQDEGNLKAIIAVEAEAWREIFKKAVAVGSESNAMVTAVGDADNVQRMAGLAAAGNQLMQHFFIKTDPGDDALNLYLVFMKSPGVQFVSSINFG